MVRQALNLSDAWFYTWTDKPSQYEKCKGQKIAFEFVPMIIGINFEIDDVKKSLVEWKNLNANYLLGKDVLLV